MPHKDAEERKAYHKKYHAEWYQLNKEKRNSQIKEYKLTKSDDWRKGIGQKHHLKTRYGISPEEYTRMAEDQDYRCAICSKDVLENIRGGIQVALYVDHNHTTNKVRKLLCMACNCGLGLFQDSKEIIEKALKYMLEHSEP